jgi:hypothetical protein
MISLRFAILPTVVLTAACAGPEPDATETTGAAALTSAGATPESIYTNIGAASCKVTDEGEGFTTSDCGGVGRYRFMLQEDDLRFSAVIKSPLGDGDLHLFGGSLDAWPAPKMGGGFQDVGPKIEWRVPKSAKASPYVLIFRLTENDGQDQFLIVAKVTEAGACLFQIVDGRGANANVVARQSADAARTSSCPAR